MKTYQLLYLYAFLLLLAASCEKKPQDANAAKNRVEKLLEKGEDYNADPVVREQYLDSAFVQLSNSTNDSISRYFLRRVIVSYYDISKYDKSLASSKKVYHLGAEAKDTVSMAKGMHFSGVSFYGQEKNDSAFYYYTQAENFYKNLHDTSSLGEVILYKAYIYYNIGEYVFCETEAFKALKLLYNENRTLDVYNCYNLIATAFDGQNNNEDAIRYFELAMQQLDNLKKEGYTEENLVPYRVTSLNNLGLVYVKMGRNDKAISIYQEALAYNNIKDINASLYAKLLNNLAYAKFKAGDNTGLPDMFYKSLKIRQELQNKSGVITSNINLGEYYLYNKDTVRALGYFGKAYTQAKEIKSHFDILNALKMLADVDKKNNHKYSERYIALSDSLQDLTKSNRNKYARIEYETDRLQDEKEALGRKNTFITGVSVVVLLFVAAIFIIYYLNSRNKELLLIQEQQKANEEIYELMFEQQGKIETARTEEKSRIAMELHDGILNNIYAVRLNLEFINKKADDESIARRKEYIKELQNVEAEIRGVSHDLSRNALFNQEQGFDNMLEFMITSQKNNFDTEFEAALDPDINWESMSNICKVNLYRIIQETLQNINKYSQAKHAKVTVDKKDSTVVMKVTDNGIGFDPEKAKGGIGLKNLRKRADALNGTLSISSGQGKGATIEVAFPV